MGKHTSRIVVLALLVSLVVIAAQCGVMAQRRARAAGTAQLATMVVFPLDIAANVTVADTFGQHVSTAFRTAMVGNGKYALFLFSDRMAPMRRAKDDGTLTKSDIDGPYADDKEKTDRLVSILAADVYFVGTVNEANIDAANKKASATVSGNLVDMKQGKIVRGVAVVADVPESMGFTDDKALTAALAKNVADQLAVQLMKSEAASAP